MKRQTVLILEMDDLRLRWLHDLCKARNQTLPQLAAELLHNAALDYQQAHYPDSDPADTPMMAKTGVSRAAPRKEG